MIFRLLLNFCKLNSDANSELYSGLMFHIFSIARLWYGHPCFFRGGFLCVHIFLPGLLFVAVYFLSAKRAWKIILKKLKGKPLYLE